jgi:ribosomal protein S18 acetylase RimI-like enzyme
VPVDEDPSRGPDGRVLLDAAGKPIARYDHKVRETYAIADLFEREPGVTAADAAAAVLADLRGMRIAGDEELGRRLLAAGGRPVRHGHMYSYDFRRTPPPREWDRPPGIRLTDIDRPAADLVEARVAAYPSDHPDHPLVPEDHAAELDAFIYGGRFGPVLRGSGLAVADDGSVVGAIVLATIPGDPPANGPWVIDVFRHPDYRGVGRALVQRALALAEADTLGLIVTEGNDAARRLYESLGFRLLSSALVVQL